MELIGNGFLLPSGPLREPFKSIRKAQIIIINGKRNIAFEKKIKFQYTKDESVNNDSNDVVENNKDMSTEDTDDKRIVDDNLDNTFENKITFNRH